MRIRKKEVQSEIFTGSMADIYLLHDHIGIFG